MCWAFRFVDFELFLEWFSEMLPQNVSSSLGICNFNDIKFAKPRAQSDQESDMELAIYLTSEVPYSLEELNCSGSENRF